MLRGNDFRPDWASAPGDTIADILAERQISVLDFAELMGHAPQHIHDLLDGHAVITIETAQKLASILGATAGFWLRRETQFREDLARHESKARVAAEKDWLFALPVRDMCKFGWIEDGLKTAEAKIAACLSFFGVPDVTSWQHTYRDVLEGAAFRTSPSFKSEMSAVAAWLRKGQIESESINCKPWNSQGLQDSLPSLRMLSRKRDPQVFIPAIQKLCADFGVAVVVVRAPSKCRASGATRFTSTDKAVLQLSFRHLSDDHFWFTFFHEVGHLLLHGKKSLFVEGVAPSSTKEEEEANAFAAQTLIPPLYHDEFMSLGASMRDVVKFAKHVGVSPGVVVGQLQHYGKIRRSELNNLKTWFTWDG